MLQRTLAFLFAGGTHQAKRSPANSGGLECIWDSPADWKLALLDAIALAPEDVPKRPDHLTVWSHDHHKWLSKATAADVFEAGLSEEQKASAKETAVLMLFYPSEKGMRCNAFDRSGGMTLPLTMRGSKLRSHAGQMSLPGGRCDPGEDPVSAAIRETQEEVGIEESEYEILGSLPKMWSYVGKCWITPVVGFSFVPLTPKIASPDEVAGLHFLQMSPLLFQSPETHFRIEKKYSRNWGGRITMPCFLAPDLPNGEVLLQKDFRKLPMSASSWTHNPQFPAALHSVELPGVREEGEGRSEEEEEGQKKEKYIESLQRYHLDEVSAMAKTNRIALPSHHKEHHGLVWGLTSLILSNMLLRLSHPSIVNHAVVDSSPSRDNSSTLIDAGDGEGIVIPGSLRAEGSKNRSLLSGGGLKGSSIVFADPEDPEIMAVRGGITTNQETTTTAEEMTTTKDSAQRRTSISEGQSWSTSVQSKEAKPKRVEADISPLSGVNLKDLASLQSKVDPKKSMMSDRLQSQYQNSRRFTEVAGFQEEGAKKRVGSTAAKVL